MKKIFDVKVGKHRIDCIKKSFCDDPYGSTIEFIKNNVAFEDLNSGVQKMLISSFALLLFSFKEFEAGDSFLVFDGVKIPHKYVYDFITLSSVEQLKDLLTVNISRSCPEAFVKNMNSMFYSKLKN